jgi:mannose-1-phosphate guanylyltransferase
MGRPLLFHWLQALTDAGVSEVLINTHHLASLVEAAVARWPGSLTVHLSHERQLLGSGGTVVANRRFVEHERDFFVIYADNLTSAPLEPLLTAHWQSGAIFTTYVYETSRPQEKGTCLLEPQSDRIVGFEEKSPRPTSHIASAGIGVASHEIFRYMSERLPLDLSRDVMPGLVGRMQAVRTSAYIRDIGSLADYYAAQEDWWRMAGSQVTRRVREAGATGGFTESTTW